MSEPVHVLSTRHFGWCHRPGTPPTKNPPTDAGIAKSYAVAPDSHTRVGLWVDDSGSGRWLELARGSGNSHDTRGTGSPWLRRDGGERLASGSDALSRHP